MSCPTAADAETSGTIGPEGGALQVVNYAVNIPAGAVPAPTLFRLLVPAGTTDRIDVTADGQHGYRFLRPVTMRIDLSRCGRVTRNPAAAMTAWYVGDAGEFLEDMGGVLDADRKAFTFTTPHLSGYSIATAIADSSTSTPPDEGDRTSTGF